LFARCGHCKKIEKDLDLASKELAKTGVQVSDIYVIVIPTVTIFCECQAIIAQIDATIPENKEIADNLGIEGYPTLAVYSNGDRLSDYWGSLTHRYC
jgi:thiol-disulfide isomerase/thioredoxin